MGHKLWSIILMYIGVTLFTRRHNLSRSLSTSCRPRAQLDTMPFRNLFLQHCIDKLMLLYGTQAGKLWRFDFNSIHGAASATDVLNLSLEVLATTIL